MVKNILHVFDDYLYFRCNGRSACEAFANVTHFPNDIDPCPSTVKYLEAQFYCMKMKITQPPPSPTSEVFNFTGMYTKTYLLSISLL